MSESLCLAAVLTALKAEGSTALSLAQLASLPTKPEHYNQVLVTERLRPTRRIGGSGDARSWRVSILSVAKREGDAQNEREIARRALEDQTLTIDGVESGALVSGIETSPIVPDDGWFSGASEFVFAS